jgi:hypothetical protein
MKTTQEKIDYLESRIELSENYLNSVYDTNARYFVHVKISKWIDRLNKLKNKV